MALSTKRHAPSTLFPYTTLFRSGVNAGRLKIVVFVYAALLACVSGWLYAHLQRFVNPTPFGLNQGIEYRSEEHTSELQSRRDIVCRLLLETNSKEQGKSISQSYI